MTISLFSYFYTKIESKLPARVRSLSSSWKGPQAVHGVADMATGTLALLVGITLSHRSSSPEPSFTARLLMVGGFIHALGGVVALAHAMKTSEQQGLQNLQNTYAAQQVHVQALIASVQKRTGMLNT